MHEGDISEAAVYDGLTARGGVRCYRQAKRATWAYKKQLEEAEAWVPLTVRG